jgi:glutamate racemase
MLAAINPLQPDAAAQAGPAVEMMPNLPAAAMVVIAGNPKVPTFLPEAKHRKALPVLPSVQPAIHRAVTLAVAIPAIPVAKEVRNSIRVYKTKIPLLQRDFLIWVIEKNYRCETCGVKREIIAFEKI